MKARKVRTTHLHKQLGKTDQKPQSQPSRLAHCFLATPLLHLPPPLSETKPSQRQFALLPLHGGDGAKDSRAGTQRVDDVRCDRARVRMRIPHHARSCSFERRCCWPTCLRRRWCPDISAGTVDAGEGDHQRPLVLLVQRESYRKNEVLHSHQPLLGDAGHGALSRCRPRQLIRIPSRRARAMMGTPMRLATRREALSSSASGAGIAERPCCQVGRPWCRVC